MKKLTKNVCIFVIAICLLFALCACNNDKIYNLLNEMTNAEYSAITLKVTSSKDGDSLQNVFSINFGEEETIVNYTCQKFATFGDSDAVSIPTDYIVTSTGSVIIRDGKIVEQNGDSVDVAFEEITTLGINFNKNYFANISRTTSSFNADVVNPKGFTGNSQLNCTNMTLKVYFDDVFQLITIKYVSENGFEIQLQYIFNAA